MDKVKVNLSQEQASKVRCMIGEMETSSASSGELVYLYGSIKWKLNTVEINLFEE